MIIIPFMPKYTVKRKETEVKPVKTNTEEFNELLEECRQELERSKDNAFTDRI